MTESRKPVVRIAPSPTGYFHIGTARTALFNYLFAKRYGGTFIVRIEDTDKERSKKEYEEDILEGMRWLGLSWDELYRQSERTEIYKKHLLQMIERGSAYISKEPSQKDPTKEVPVVRFKNPNKTITFHDVIRGELEFHTKELGDFVIAKSLEEPLYHLAVVVDDFESGVTHVIRGEDHISNTQRQILIQEAIDATRPEYAHLPLILNPDRSKMSKRFAATSVRDYRDAGYIPAGFINFLALLGWAPEGEQEVFTLDELTQIFDLTRVHKSGAIFNIDKFKWTNRAHLLKLSDSAFDQEALKYVPLRVQSLPGWSVSMWGATRPLIRERVSTFGEIRTMAETGELDYFFTKPTLTKEKISWKGEEASATQGRLAEVEKLLSPLSEWNMDAIKNVLMPYAEQEGKGSVLWPTRYALSGQEKSPDPFTLLTILGKEESLARIGHAREQLSS